jgi:hypothetical protein
VIEQEIARNPIPTIVIADRFVNDGMPDTARTEGRWALDTMDVPEVELVRVEGRAVALRWRPGRPDSGPR